MLSNAVAILSAGWILFAPALCVAGLLRHSCDCSVASASCSPCCDDDGGALRESAFETGCGCVAEGCSHDDCSGDPCPDTVGTGRELRGEEAAFRAPLLEAPRLERGFAPGGSLAPAARCPAPSRPAGPAGNLPYPPSDLPLLV